MSGPAAAPATRFHDLVIINDQTRAEWHAPRGRVYEGRIEVAGADGNEPPDGFFIAPTHTYTVVAIDGGDRLRSFPSLSLDRSRTVLPRLVVFG
ncbi:MAG: hypothetical protein JOZ54_03465 [Acidobacteria bacterium]|nr:hypothetical protein [Acidobacteriota bacterium]